MQEQPPTRKEFNELKEQVKRIEQRTEPITIPRIELDPGGIQNRLDNHAEMLKEISTKQDEQEEHLTLIYTDVGHMKADVGVLKGDVSVLKQDVGELKQAVARIESNMEKRLDSIAEVQKLILDRLPPQGE